MTSLLDALKNFIKLNQLDLFISETSQFHPVLDKLTSLGLLKKIAFNRQSYFVLNYHDQILSVLFENQKPIFIDFDSPQIKLQKSKTNRKSSICKALGLKKNQDHLIDLTAGFGKDSFVVSKYFSKVTWVERNPIVYMLLENALERFKNKFSDEAQKFDLIFADSDSYLENLKEDFGAILYFDFMFVDKKAKSNKEMFFLKKITEGDSEIDLNQILQKAIKKKPIRTVLKTKTYMGSIKPKQVYPGSTVKYLVF